jgi:hypothetical protein
MSSVEKVVIFLISYKNPKIFMKLSITGKQLPRFQCNIQKFNSELCSVSVSTSSYASQLESWHLYHVFWQLEWHTHSF